jgi:RNA polymerase sigma factor (TIGR02999 family)
MSEVTQILSQIECGNPAAAEQLLPLIYDELRRIAALKLAHEKPGQTLEATALVHEAYIRLVDTDRVQHWNSRGRFFAAAAEAMRRILVERARRRLTIKHGGQFRRLDFDDQLIIDEERGAELLALDDALADLERHDPQASQLVKLRYFAGLSHQDAANAMSITRRVADRLWLVAKAWLYNRLAAG